MVEFGKIAALPPANVLILNVLKQVIFSNLWNLICLPYLIVYSIKIGNP